MDTMTDAEKTAIYINKMISTTFACIFGIICIVFVGIHVANAIMYIDKPILNFFAGLLP